MEDKVANPEKWTSGEQSGLQFWRGGYEVQTRDNRQCLDTAGSQCGPGPLESSNCQWSRGGRFCRGPLVKRTLLDRRSSRSWGGEVQVRDSIAVTRWHPELFNLIQGEEVVNITRQTWTSEELPPSASRR
ncbi:hypothetical protein BASA61_002958 [Batrachochytrium salamandrivorans]|nr:hypothetical protein BASA61_002958 [Batrachochytrium salamandrivorans]